MDKAKIEIIDFTNNLKDHIKRLNYEWLEKHFCIEKGDEVSLSNPQGEIIGRGGMIFYATLNNEIVGTASLLKKSEQVFELAKMAVATHAQGFKIGTLLLEHCLSILKQRNIEKCILYSNTKLESALHLYRKYGFVEVELEPGLYERANIKMEKRMEEKNISF
jgi:ribosomal protein S18 acetylase RimI-like enzyme